MFSLVKRLWQWFMRPNAVAGQGVLLVIGIVAGIIFWGGFNTAMEATNTMGFCISCHEMRDNVYEEYKKTVHFQNPSGVRAKCSDCHVPHDWVPKVIRKVKATNELWHKLVGTIDTAEKFEAHRLEMATRVWQSMKESDSRECRNCHSYAAMDFAHQSRRAREKMEPVAASGEKTCIECHQGIAHRLPAGVGDDEGDD
jgi:nitrate/TMAO reductase-like tetraheme cytochrome c subunit